MAHTWDAQQPADAFDLDTPECASAPVDTQDLAASSEADQLPSRQEVPSVIHSCQADETKTGQMPLH